MNIISCNTSQCDDQFVWLKQTNTVYSESCKTEITVNNVNEMLESNESNYYTHDRNTNKFYKVNCGHDPRFPNTWFTHATNTMSRNKDSYVKVANSLKQNWVGWTFYKTA